MKLIHKKQKWEGQFTYQEGYETLDQYREVDFIMDIEVDQDSFVGYSTDSESREVFDQPATIKGFFEENTINFVLKYPYSYYRDENGVLVGDKDAEHPEIHYLGFYDEDLKEYKGNWEMVIAQEAYGSGYFEETLNGGFMVRRIN